MLTKIFVIMFLLVVMLLDWKSVSAFEFPSFKDSIVSFPSIQPFPFPSKTPKPSDQPDSTPEPTKTPEPTQEFEITDVEPSSANFMQEFVIYGAKFGDTAGLVNFRYYSQSFSSGSAPIVSWGDNEIHAKVPALKKGSYRIQVITSDGRKTEEERFSVKNGQPVVNSTSLRSINGEYELVFSGKEFGKRGSINIYDGSTFVGTGLIQYWSTSRVRFDFPNLPRKQYGFEIEAADGRKSNLLYFTVGK